MYIVHIHITIFIFTSDQKHACDLSTIDHSDVEVCKDSKEFVLKRVGKATPSECL